jgi:hypothetical protein
MEEREMPQPEKKSGGSEATPSVDKGTPERTFVGEIPTSKVTDDYPTGDHRRAARFAEEGKALVASGVEPTVENLGNKWIPGMKSPNPGGRPAENPMRRAIQVFLESCDTTEPNAVPRMQKMITNIYEISLKGGRDAVNAFQALAVYGYGKPMPSNEELSALENQGIRVVVLPALPEKKEREELPLLPSFDVEIVEPDAS